MNCPICNVKRHDKIYRLCDNMQILGESFPEEEAFIVSCENCGLVYMATQATQDDYIAYYKYGAIAPKYYDMFGKEETEHYYEHILSVIQPYITVESKLLDVAGAWGELAKFISDKGFRNITVVDPNELCIDRAKEKELTTSLCSSVDMADHLTEKYELIILNHTLEHIVDVEKSMENINALLKDNGYIFIEVPDAASYLNEDSAPFNFLTYEHVLHLTSGDLNNIARIYGYDVVEIKEYYKKVSHYPSIYVVLKKNGESGKPEYSNIGKVRMNLYIEKSKSAMEEFINPLRKSSEPLVLWGIGASTASLLELFAGCNVIALIDSNPKRQGLIFNIDGKKHEIERPETVNDGTIVILSIPYYASIENQIRGMNFNNKIVGLGR